MKKLTECQKCYIAGMLDGEGQVSITKHTQESGIGIVLHPRFAIHNTNLEVIKYIQNLVGGHIRPKKPRKPNHKVGYALEIGKRNEVIKILEILLPILIIKQKQAVLLLEFCRFRNEKILKRYSSRDIEYHEEMKKLNKKGVD